MKLIEIRDYLQLVGRATLQDLARHFRMQESAMEQMLLFWVKKGRLRQCEISSQCAKGCCACPVSRMPSKYLYVWQ